MNVTGVFNCSRVVTASMRKAGWGRIINISSASILLRRLADNENSPQVHEEAARAIIDLTSVVRTLTVVARPSRSMTFSL